MSVAPNPVKQADIVHVRNFMTFHFGTGKARHSMRKASPQPSPPQYSKTPPLHRPTNHYPVRGGNPRHFSSKSRLRSGKNLPLCGKNPPRPTVSSRLRASASAQPLFCPDPGESRSDHGNQPGTKSLDRRLESVTSCRDDGNSRLSPPSKNPNSTQYPYGFYDF